MYIFSGINYSLAFEWMARYTDTVKYDVHYVFLYTDVPLLAKVLNKNNLQTHFIKYRGKKDLPKTTIKLINLLRKIKPEIVHTHLFDANVAGLTAAKLSGIKKRIYTRHHSTYHHTYHPHAVRYDRYCNMLATHIVAITNTVADVLINMEHVSPQKISVVHHGFDISSFENPNESVIGSLKEKYNPHQQRPVIGVISRFTEWKGVQYIIPAFKKLLNNFPDALLMLANATGDYQHEIVKLLKQIPARNYVTIDFEKDIIALYRLFDIFVHVPIDEHSEAFGQVYIEALAAGLPSVFTLSGIANDFIENNVNAAVVTYKNEDEILNAFMRILNDASFAQRIARKGKTDVEKLFGIERMIKELEQVYEH